MLFRSKEICGELGYLSSSFILKALTDEIICVSFPFTLNFKIKVFKFGCQLNSESQTRQLSKTAEFLTLLTSLIQEVAYFWKKILKSFQCFSFSVTLSCGEGRQL